MRVADSRPKINNISVDGEGHLQPEPNPWIGIFKVDPNFLDGGPKDWESAVVYYEGPFNARREYINGRGKAKIIHARWDEGTPKIVINVEGVEAPELDKELKHKIRERYTPNWPAKKRAR